MQGKQQALRARRRTGSTTQRRWMQQQPQRLSRLTWVSLVPGLPLQSLALAQAQAQVLAS